MCQKQLGLKLKKWLCNRLIKKKTKINKIVDNRLFYNRDKCYFYDSYITIVLHV